LRLTSFAARARCMFVAMMSLALVIRAQGVGVVGCGDDGGRLQLLVITSGDIMRARRASLGATQIDDVHRLNAAAAASPSTPFASPSTSTIVHQLLSTVYSCQMPAHT